MRKKNNTWLVIVLVIVVAVGLLGFNGFSRLPVNSSQTSPATGNPSTNSGSGGPVLDTNTWQIAAYTNTNTNVPCINPSLPVPDQYHIHPQLTIIINGHNITIPGQIGLTSPPCEREIHTHDDTGTIHVEPNFYQPFTLGDFFNVWGEPFSSSTIFNLTTDLSHTLTMTVDGKSSDEFKNLVLKDKQQIVVEYK